MKKLGFFNKIIFKINTVIALLLLLSYLLPYISPLQFTNISVLSLAVPLLLILNILFVVYWIVRLKIQFLLSVLMLLVGWNHLAKLYKSPFSNTTVNQQNSISLMSYNVRLFNVYNWLQNTNVKNEIVDFIEKQQPDILSFQEYSKKQNIKLKGYTSYNTTFTKNIKSGLAIYSKYKIINSGSLEFKNTNNNAIFIDVIKENDTIRIYNIHLQSSGISSDVEEISQENSWRLFKKVRSTFKSQETQVNQILEHKSKCPYKVIIMGDFNNTAFSYVYKQLLDDNLEDAFAVAGTGFGKTYDFKYFPFRIDFILTDKTFEVSNFKTFNDLKLSDHYPIKADITIHK